MAALCALNGGVRAARSGAPGSFTACEPAAPAPMSLPRSVDEARRLLWLWNRRRLRRRESARRPDYASWCARHDTLDAGMATLVRARCDALPAPPSFELRLPLRADAQAALERSLAALRAQWYPHWRLRWAPAGDDAAPSWARAWLERAHAADARVAGSVVDDAGAARADWIAELEPGECWREHALALFALALAARPRALLAYGDHDTLGPDGVRRDPAFKPEWNADWLLSHDWLRAPLVWRAAHLQACPLPARASRHERLLHLSAGLDGDAVVHLPHVLAHLPARAAGALEADAPAVVAHLARQGEQASATLGRHGVRVCFALPEPAPRVSIVIPTRNGGRLLRRCLGSLLARTAYPDYEVLIVDNGSDDARCLAYLAAAARDARVRVRRDARPFNFAALNNAALADCRGRVLALLNDDVEIEHGDWLREMVSLACRPGVGAVGARLLYGDRSVQHAGVILGIHGGSGHLHRHLGEHEPGCLGRAQQLQSLSAVTAACLVVQRRHYEAVGGMDAEAFAVTFNDTDLCLRLGARGLRTLYTPHATLLHHESVTRGSDRHGLRRARFEAARAAFARRWPAAVAADPAYNPNLTLEAEHCGLADPPRVGPIEGLPPVCR